MAFVIEQSELKQIKCETRNGDKCGFNQTFGGQIKNNFNFIRENVARGGARLENVKIHVQENDRKIIIRYNANKIYKNYSLILTICLDSRTDELKLKTRLLNLYGNYGKVQGTERRKLVTKYLCSRTAGVQSEFRVAINVETGQLKFDSPSYRFDLAGHYNSLVDMLKKLHRQLGHQLRVAQELLLSILLLTEDQFGCLYQDVQLRLQDKKLVQANRFANFTNVFLNLASETSNEELDLNLNFRKEAESFQRLRQNRRRQGPEIASLALYITRNSRQTQEQNKTEELQLNFLERVYISERLGLPSSQKSPIPNENFFVLNYIKVNKKLSQTMIKKIKVGGFTTIYLSEIQYWYVGSYCVGVLQESFQGTPPLRKSIIIKREDKRTAQLSGKSRVAHERFILTKIKFGVSMFLPKYYLLAEKDNSYENDLLVDYIGTPNLSDYIDKNRATISFNTKIYFILMIAQALRYLKEYRIAHLDLKPSNIMTYRRLNLKLIDFGESYHPELLKTHQPGFSMPYSAPENYTFQDSYDSKNDVFSLGIIMYELFIGQYPFFFYDEALRHRIYTDGTYLDYWLEAPEKILVNGDAIIMPTIYSIMGKCLRPNPEDRPELEWIALVFREFIECLK